MPASARDYGERVHYLAVTHTAHDLAKRILAAEAEVERLRQASEHRGKLLLTFADLATDEELDRYGFARKAEVERLREVNADLCERQHDYPTDLSLMRDEKEWRAAFQRARDALNPSP